MPALGLAQETGKVVRWLRREGDEITSGEPLVEIETDKVTVEVEAPAGGTLGGVIATDGQEVPVGSTIAFILGDGEAAPEPAGQPPGVAAAASRTTARPDPPPAGNGPDAGRPRRALASPKARRLAAAHALSIEEITGSGPHGAVVAADVEALAGRSPAAADSVSSLWKTMAERTLRSWQSVPHFYLLREVDASRLNAWRDAARKREGYERVTHTDLLVAIAAAALRAHPRVNASWQDGTIVRAPEVNVGVAVAVDDGLIVPVVHSADTLTLRELVARRVALVDRARSGRLEARDVTGGTFTISNLGMFGVDAFAAIVNAPQAAILAVGRIADRLVPDAGAPAVRPMCTLALSCDHRVVDGATAARFLDTLASLLEEPTGLVP